MRYVQVALAEFLGAFGLVFFGAGAICTDVLVRGGAPFGAADLIAIALAHAIVLGVMVSALGHISGAHFNPAVTIGAALTRHIEPLMAGLYIVAQLVAGVAAALLLKYIFAANVTTAAMFGAPTPTVTTLRAYVIEAVLTFFLVTVVFATAIDPKGAFNKIAGLAIGLVLLFDILLGGPLTGAAMNPARAFGPALVAGILDGKHFFIYWLGPIVGGAIAAFVYQGILMSQPESGDLPAPEDPPSS